MSTNEVSLKNTNLYVEGPIEDYGDLRVLPEEIIASIFSLCPRNSILLLNRNFKELASTNIPLNLNFFKKQGSKAVTLAEFELILKKNPNISSIRLPQDATNEYLKLISIHCKFIQKIDASDCKKITDDGLDYLLELQELENLNLSSCKKITDAGFSKLSKLPQLKVLNLTLCELKNQGLDSILGLTNLEELTLEKCEIDHPELSKLVSLCKLKILNISYCEIGNEGIEDISKLVELEELNLKNCKITDAGLPTLLNLRKLKILKLNMDFDTGFQQLASLDALEVLEISTCTFRNDSILIPFTNSPKLKSLDLSYCNITDEKMSCLSQFTHLQHLNLYGACQDVSPEGFEHLKGLSLESLVIGGNSFICDVTKDTISTLKKLKYLDISNLRISDEFLTGIKDLTLLESLNLKGCTDITSHGLEHLSELTKNKLKNIDITDCHKIRLRKMEFAAIAE